MALEAALERFARLHGILCTAGGNPSLAWLKAYRNYETLRRHLTSAGVNIDAELERRFGFRRHIGFSPDADFRNGIEIHRRYRARLAQVGGTTKNGGASR